METSLSAKPLTLTEAAARRMRSIVAQASEPGTIVRITVGTTGCSGLSYQMGYATEPGPTDEEIEDSGITFLVDREAIVYLLGSTIDYVEEKLHSGFVFDNPNEKGRCGCGESFHT